MHLCQLPSLNGLLEPEGRASGMVTRDFFMIILLGQCHTCLDICWTSESELNSYILYIYIYIDFMMHVSQPAIEDFAEGWVVEMLKLAYLMCIKYII